MQCSQYAVTILVRLAAAAGTGLVASHRLHLSQ